jgi:catechol-2,3-dioxygenase
MAPQLQTIDHIHVFVSNRESSEAWYREVLGLHRQPDLEFWAGDGGPLTLTNDTGTIHLALFERPREKCRSTIALGVGADDFIEWKTHLQRALGKELTPEDHAVSWSLYFQDPDGNPYEITSYQYEAISECLAAG